MEKLSSCPQCTGLVPAAQSACPHCGAQPRRASKIATGVVGSLAAAMLLGCAYGVPTMDCDLPDGGRIVTSGVCPNPDGGK